MKEKITLFMETTKKSPEQTISEIQILLSKFGIGQMQMRFDPNGNIESVYFTIKVADKEMPYKLPANHEALMELAKKGETKYLKAGDENQARRVAWRQIYKWMEAQIAIVRTNQTTIHQALLGYMMIDKDQTIFDKLVSTKFEGYLLE